MTTILSSLQQSFLLLQCAEFLNASSVLHESPTLIRGHVCVLDYAVDFYVDSHGDIHFDCATEQLTMNDDGDTWQGCLVDGVPHGRGVVSKMNDVVIETFLKDGKVNGPTVVREDDRVVETGCFLNGMREWVEVEYAPNGDSIYQAYYHDTLVSSMVNGGTRVTIDGTTGDAFRKQTGLLCPHPLLFSAGDRVTFTYYLVNRNDLYVLQAHLKELVIGENTTIESYNVVVQDCPNLERFIVKENSCNDSSGQGVVRVHKCPRLATIHFEANTFVFFSSLLLGGIPRFRC